MKMILFTILGLAGIFLVIGLGFYTFSPQFGARGGISAAAKKSPNFENGVFKNLEKTVMMTDFKWSSLGDYFKKGKKEPENSLTAEKISKETINSLADSLTRVTWFGHSALLLEISGKKIFLDPMLGESASPIPFMGPKRFQDELPISMEDLPELDAVLISHDHYDHLDYESILKLKDKVKKFYLPLGVGEHLIKWGVDKEKIVELDWWTDVTLDDLTFAATPSRHFSGRGFARNQTLWCSWVIKSDSSSVFFSGDSGYGKHFKEIGEKYGPFDITLMECGQYNKQWANIHMMPEETTQAHVDVKGKLLLPIHWGAFVLALHDWTDPIERVTAKAQELGVDVVTPRVGQPIVLQDAETYSNWWKVQ